MTIILFYFCVCVVACIKMSFLFIYVFNFCGWGRDFLNGIYWGDIDSITLYRFQVYTPTIPICIVYCMFTPSSQGSFHVQRVYPPSS